MQVDISGTLHSAAGRKIKTGSGTVCITLTVPMPRQKNYSLWFIIARLYLESHVKQRLELKTHLKKLQKLILQH